jgi:hypothetical protein
MQNSIPILLSHDLNAELGEVLAPTITGSRSSEDVRISEKSVSGYEVFSYIAEVYIFIIYKSVC